jgi:hypothetical protein
MTNSSLKQDPNQLTLYVHPWYEALSEQENTTPCEFGLTLKPSEEIIGLKSIEWAAGLYEGEGSLCPKYKDPKKQWKLTVKMTDYDVVKTFHDTLQVGKLYGPLRPPSLASHHKTCWEVRVTNTKDILKVIYDFYPYMGERRRAKFDEFLTHHYGN